MKKELIKALDLALTGKWEDAHEIVQSFESEQACWIHGILHKIEGDISNAKYWYRRAGIEFSKKDALAELKEVRELLKNAE